MAITLGIKPPTAVYEYTWVPPVAEGDALASAVLTVSSGTAVIDSYEVAADSVLIIISGGTAGAYTTIAASADTDGGETLVETIYLPIASADANGTTVADICGFALRKVFGRDDSPDAGALSDAIERLSDMLAHWRATGADVGATVPLTGSTVLYVNDAYLMAIKNNLAMQVLDLYGEPIPAMVVENARRGLQLIKTANLPDERGKAAYY